MKQLPIRFQIKNKKTQSIQLAFDPTKTKYADLVEFFFRCHNPTTLNYQGNDRGTQYRSAIFYADEEQKKIAQGLKIKMTNRLNI